MYSQFIFLFALAQVVLGFSPLRLSSQDFKSENISAGVSKESDGNVTSACSPSPMADDKTELVYLANEQVPKGTVLDRNKLSKSEFLPNTRTFVLIHGFQNNANASWMVTLRDELLVKQRSNVLSVQWYSNLWFTEYWTAAGFVPGVGADVAQLLKDLDQAKGLPPGLVHLVGHSLGAHVAGFVGKNLPNIARISGLDPAGPAFRDVPPAERLHHTDAQYVDVIHTNADDDAYPLECLGIGKAIGHTDFYPNGGKYQPQCGGRSAGIDTAAAPRACPPPATDVNEPVQPRGGKTCSHSMAIDYFTQSISFEKGPSKFLALKCDNYKIFKGNQSDCQDEEFDQYMGWNADPRGTGSYYLDVHCAGSTPPHLLWAPVVAILIANQDIK